MHTQENARTTTPSMKTSTYHIPALISLDEKDAAAAVAAASAADPPAMEPRHAGEPAVLYPGAALLCKEDGRHDGGEKL